jgi:hypothetical protein
VAKKTNKERNERRAVVEQLRKEQARKERMRGLLILGVSVAVVIGLLAAALVPYLQDRARKKELEGMALEKLGAAESAAGCQDRQIVDAEGSGDHAAPGTPIQYDAAPPAFGSHWGNFLQGVEIRTFYNTEDRPEVERLVHSLEHGHTILWYDDTVKPGTEAYEQIQEIANKLGDGSYFMAAPWQASDGAAFPEGTHVALTHWTGPSKQQGITQYCAAPSGTVVKAFMTDYDKMNAPEPGAA